MSAGAGFLTHPLLSARGVAHGFGERGARAPSGVLRPRQVHGSQVVLAGPEGWDEAPEGDAVLCSAPGRSVGVVTADCVPVLLACGSWVAAVHAGWRGLARGVVAAAVSELRQRANADACVAVIGPHIGPCCYEIDAPVVEGLAQRFERHLSDALRPARPGHHRLDLGLLVRRALLDAGLETPCVASLPDACTCCHATRFHSYRRDGRAAGRLVHYVTVASGSRRGP